MNIKATRRWVNRVPGSIVVGFFVAMSACGGSSTPPPTSEPEPKCPVKLQVTATRSANATGEDMGRPVQLRVYQLASAPALEHAAFEEIWQRDEEVLGADLLEREEHTMYPGNTEVFAVKLAPKAKNLGVVALFREPQAQNWFIIYELGGAQEPPCPEDPVFQAELEGMMIQDLSKAGD